MSKCQFIKSDKTRCKAEAIDEDVFCFWHSENTKAKREIALSEGGQSPKRNYGREDEISITNTKDVSQSKVKPYALKDGKIAIPKYEGKARYDFAKLIVKIFGPLEEWKIAIVIWLAVIVNCSFWILVSRAF